MRKNLTSVLALLCALLTLVIALFCLGALKKSNETLTARIAALEAQVARLSENSAPEEELPDISCNLLVDSWSAADGTLTADIFAVAQLEEGLEVSQAQLYLICGEQSQIRDIEMLPGEGTATFEANLPGLIFDLPEMENGDELTLELVVTITGGRNIHARVNWYLEDGEPYLVSG